MDEFIESIEKTNLGLTKFEMIENYHLLQASVVEDVSLLITVVFSFIIATYFVGAKITKSQAIAITALYSVFVWLTLVGILIGLIGVNVTAIGINGSGSIAASFLYPVFFAVAWGYSVFFLYQTRRKERDT